MYVCTHLWWSSFLSRCQDSFLQHPRHVGSVGWHVCFTQVTSKHSTADTCVVYQLPSEILLQLCKGSWQIFCISGIMATNHTLFMTSAFPKAIAYRAFSANVCMLHLILLLVRSKLPGLECCVWKFAIGVSSDNGSDAEPPRSFRFIVGLVRVAAHEQRVVGPAVLVELPPLRV